VKVKSRRVKHDAAAFPCYFRGSPGVREPRKGVMLRGNLYRNGGLCAAKGSHKDPCNPL